jgi:hypothetical protein
MAEGAASFAKRKMNIYIEQSIGWERITGEELVIGGRGILCYGRVMNRWNEIPITTDKSCSL